MRKHLTRKVTCSKCGKEQGNCFAYCVQCGSRLPTLLKPILDLSEKGE